MARIFCEIIGFICFEKFVNKKQLHTSVSFPAEGGGTPTYTRHLGNKKNKIDDLFSGSLIRIIMFQNIRLKN